MAETEKVHVATVAARTLETRDCYCSLTNGQPHGEWESPWVSSPVLGAGELAVEAEGIDLVTEKAHSR